VAAIAALVPGVGTALVIFPAVIYVFWAGDLFRAVGLAVWGMLAVGLIDNFLGPKLIGNGIKMHSLLVLFSVLGGISFFGPVGLLLGPLALSLFFVLLDIYFLMIKKGSRR
jgi:predicted PurR-regulated permease PerM